MQRTVQGALAAFQQTPTVLQASNCLWSGEYPAQCPHLKTLLLVLVTTLMTLLSTLFTVTLDGCRSMMFSGV